MDGIDGTLLHTNGKTFQRSNINVSLEYQKETKVLLNEIEKYTKDFIDKKKDFQYIANLVTEDHSNVVNEIFKQTDCKVDLIGFHGQTIYHSFKEKLSIQIGSPKYLSKKTGVKVVSSFRQNDIKNGGQGAPLAPIYHMAIMRDLNLDLPACFVNIGGVANLTYFDAKNLIGFDTGPGNGLMDRFAQLKINKKFDNNGQLASSGIVNTNMLNILLSNPYFKKPFPKSLDKLFFSSYLDDHLLNNLSNEDCLATLSEFTAQSIFIAIDQLPKVPKIIVLMGGGQFNNHLVTRLKTLLKVNVLISDDIDLNGQYVEAELFAYLAARSVNKLPITFPNTTGVEKALLGGKSYLDF